MLIKLRQKRNKQVTPPISKGNGDGREVNEINLTDNLIVSKQYYDECSSSEDSVDGSDTQSRSSHEISSDSEDGFSANGSLNTTPLVCEIKSSSADDSKDDCLVYSAKQKLQKLGDVVEITQKEGNNDFQITHDSTESQNSIDPLSEQNEEFLKNKMINTLTVTCPDESIQILYPTDYSTEAIKLNVDNKSSQENGDDFGEKNLVLNKNNKDDEDRMKIYHDQSIDDWMDTVTTQNDKLFSDNTIEKCINQYTYKQKSTEDNVVEKLNNLVVTDDNIDINEEYNSSTPIPITDKNDETISIKLPWKQLNNNEEFHIRKSVE